MKPPAPFRALLAVAIGTAPLAAQQGDTARQLPELGVTASRGALPLGAAGLSITEMRGDAARRGRTTPTLDELLAFVPGVLSRERTDPTLDTRIAIRGAGSRANFGVRGVRVVLDGVPATLPDGQTPLTQLDLDMVERIEVARGPLAALHGNGSLGVVSLTSPARWSPGFRIRVAGDATTDRAMHREAIAIGFGGAQIGGLFAGSRQVEPGVRDHARAEQWRYRASGEWRLSEATRLTVRGSWAHDPELQSPGALTLAEFATSPRMAAPNSLARDAGKQIDQQQLSLGLSQRAGTMVIDASAWTIWRELANPLAAPAPAPATATEGTWVGIDRQVIGARTTVQRPLGLRTIATAGLDLQRMIDDRVNRRHDAGVVAGPVFLDQRERVSELGAFGQLVVFAGQGVSIRAGGRHDRVGFAVDDRLEPAAGGERTMSAWSGSAAVAWRHDLAELWLGIGTAFETPTTTELANRPDGSTGINRELDPSRTVSIESGIRLHRGAVALEAVAFAGRTTDAISPVAESGGRSFFANVGTTTTRGGELTVSWQPIVGFTARGTLTALQARFGALATSANGTPTSGNNLPGVVPVSARLGASYATGTLLIDLDQAWASAVWADDANTIEVPGWGAGITSALIRIALRDSAQPIAVRVAVRNLFDRAHATGVVVNGGFGRVVEPGGGRTVMVGVEMSN